MIKGIYQAAKNLNAGEKHISVVANNLANLNTTGYKREIPFSQILDSQGELKVRQYTDQRAGELTITGNPLDFAIDGKGFFVVDTENGLQLTRDGKFSLSNEGYLVNQFGHKVIGKSGEIYFGENIFDKEQSIKVNKFGQISVGDAELDDLRIVKVKEPRALDKTAGSYFSGNGVQLMDSEREDFSISQGYLESSNVNPMEEMEAMIMLNKNYQSARKVITSLDESLEKANSIGQV